MSIIDNFLETGESLRIFYEMTCGERDENNNKGVNNLGNVFENVYSIQQVPAPLHTEVNVNPLDASVIKNETPVSEVKEAISIVEDKEEVAVQLSAASHLQLVVDKTQNEDDGWLNVDKARDGVNKAFQDKDAA